MLNDLRFACRQLTRTPGLTTAAVLTLGLGIGVTVTTFTWLSATLFARLPVEHPERLVIAWAVQVEHGIGRSTVSAPDYDDWRRTAASFDRLAAAASAGYNLSGAGAPVRASAWRVTADFFDVLGIRPATGRVFTAAEEAPGAEPVVVLSHRFWTRQLGADPDILGRPIALDGVPHTVVGVAADAFSVLAVDLWTPLSEPLSAGDRGRRNLLVIGRLAPGVGLGEAAAEMAALAARLARDHPATNAGWSVRLVPLLDAISGTDAKAIWSVFVGAVLFVLLIGCANVANLLLARGLARTDEVAVRMALGAGRARLVRQFLTESLVLAALGAALGLLVAVWLNDLLRTTVLGTTPFVDQARIDGRALLFTLAVAGVSALLFGAAPAFQASALRLQETLRLGTGGAGRTPRLRQALVGTEVALATALLLVAGLFIRTGAAMLRADPGFDARGVLTARVSLPEASHAETDRVAAFYAETIARLVADGRVEAAAATTRLPLAGSASNPNRIVAIDGHEGDERPWAIDLVVTPDYFRALGIPVVEGRAFSLRDAAGAPPVALVSRAFAVRYLGGERAIGRRIRLGPEGSPWMEVIGVAADVRNDDLGAPPAPHVYLPHAQHPAREMSFLVRASGEPAVAQAALEEAVRALDRSLPVYQVRTMEQVVAADMADVPLIIGIFSVLSALALLLASVGIYGVVAYSVRQQAREIAIRLALGASRREVVALAARRTAIWTSAGLALGLAAALAVSRALAHAVDFIEQIDPLLLAAALGTVVLVIVTASYLPARHAARVDPMAALRVE